MEITLKNKSKTEKSNLIRSYELQQITDLIQFDAYDYKENDKSSKTIAYLRASEVKTKLDKFIHRFLLKNIGNGVKIKYKDENDNGKEKEVNKKSLDSFLKNNKLITCEEDISLGSDSDKVVSFNYAMKIEPVGNIKINSRDTSKGIQDESKLYFGSVGKNNKNKSARRVYCNSSLCTINFKKEIIFDAKIKYKEKPCTNFIDLVEFCLPYFFAQTNFGARSSKGYGSFKYLRSVIVSYEKEKKPKESKKEKLKQKDSKRGTSLKDLKSLAILKDDINLETNEEAKEKIKLVLTNVKKYSYDNNFYIAMNLFTDEGVYYEIKSDELKNYNKLLQNLKEDNENLFDARSDIMKLCWFLSTTMKSGYNNTSGSNKSNNKDNDNNKYYGEKYVKGAITNYFNSLYNTSSISDKAYIKAYGLNENEVTKKDESEYKFIRALLGMYDSFSKPCNINFESFKKDSSGKSDIVRMESPVLIKPLSDRLLIIPRNFYEDILGETFNIIVKRKSLSIDVPKEFDLVDFLDEYNEKYFNVIFKKAEIYSSMPSQKMRKELLDGKMEFNKIELIR